MRYCLLLVTITATVVVESRSLGDILGGHFRKGSEPAGRNRGMMYVVCRFNSIFECQSVRSA